MRLTLSGHRAAEFRGARQRFLETVIVVCHSARRQRSNRTGSTMTTPTIGRHSCLRPGARHRRGRGDRRQSSRERHQRRLAAGRRRRRSQPSAISSSTCTTSPSAAGCHPPSAEHVGELIDFVQSWDRQAPLLIHCFAGLSRSTAAAFIAMCALNPRTPEEAIARALRRSSDTAVPNRRSSRSPTSCSAARAAWSRLCAAWVATGAAMECVPFAVAADHLPRGGRRTARPERDAATSERCHCSSCPPPRESD